MSHFLLRVRCREGLGHSRTLVLLGAVASSSTAVQIRFHGTTRHGVHSTVDAPPWRRLSASDRGSGDCPTIVLCQTSGQMLKLTPPERTDARGSSDARANRPTAALGTALDVTAFRLLRWLRLSGRGSGDCPAIMWYRKSGQMLKLTPPERTDARGSSDARAERALSALVTALEVTVFWLLCRLRRSDRGSGDCPTIVWCLASDQMLKLTSSDRTDVCGSSDARARPSARWALGKAQSNGISVTVSAEAIGSWIRRLNYHRMMSGNV